ncbi:UvrB/UvrC motif-containing protein [Hymenobacter cellulosivorans]|uniref:UvrB/UvrC motif-containing protein n=1 Tax=Hymenobacter cellulosivorans TaxID=2932249 RepID=A0ABY4F747_9BACT|nr:UvrB/UvrC motif-containing protein [Hymenobacter cellulosivorans]UOQ52494.1 UvrB/UvrC motif-containing protein [Hymenobacter cellulosivorans]
MGLSTTTIRFPQGLPSFSVIKRQYEVQTGLDIFLTAKVHVAYADLADIYELQTKPSQILPLLIADAAAVQNLESKYAIDKEAYLSAQQYEQAAAIRDRIKHGKLAYNHIQNMELEVCSPAGSWYGPFYSIEFTARPDAVTVYQYLDQEYAVNSLLKVLVDLGGEYLGFTSKTPQNPPKQWSKLKQWKDYRWYNRPKK